MSNVRWAAVVGCLCGFLTSPAVKADSVSLPVGGAGSIIFVPPTSPGGDGTVTIGYLTASSTAPPGGWEWGWDLSSYPQGTLTFPAGGGPLTQPAGESTFFELTGAINGVGDQVFLAGFVTWDSVEEIDSTDALITGSVDLSIIEGGSPESPISIGNIATFGQLDYFVSCAPDNCLTVDPMGTVESLTLDYSYKNGMTAVPEPKSWWILASGMMVLAFRRTWLRR